MGNGEMALSVKQPEDGESRGALSELVEGQRTALGAAAALAGEVAKIVRANGLSRRFGGQKEHVYVEGWLTISRVQNEEPHAKVEEVIRDAQGNETIRARGWLTDRHGRVVAEAEAYVSTEEPNWKGKPFYARASMAQTRAIAKAMRLRHAWVMVMAGYDPTPAEEIDGLYQQNAGPHEQPSNPPKPLVRQNPQPKPATPVQQPVKPNPAQIDEKMLHELGVVEGETLHLPGHICKKCSGEVYLVKKAGLKAQRPGALYLECTSCRGFCGYGDEVMKNYQPAPQAGGQQ